MYRWGFMVVLLIMIALLCIGLIFQPVTTHTERFGEEQITAQSAMTIQGLGLRAQAWIEYPVYNFGLGFIALISFGGAIFSCNAMYSLKESEG